MSNPALSLWQAGSATDTGLLRATNEDRVLIDALRGIFLVVDGMGGHAAGAIAAEVARDSIARSLNEPRGEPAASIEHAIVEANNEIVALAENHQEWCGMACVLTLAIAHDDRLTWGHVGDSRLYRMLDGELVKLTPDHSPVGEREDNGQLAERAAMRHPSRHQVNRSVGTERRVSGERNFVSLGSAPFPDDAAFLFCTDGLSDALTSLEIATILNRFDGDADRVARALADAANANSGADNVTVVFLPGPAFRASPEILDATRHAATRVRLPEPRNAWKDARLIWLLLGIALGVILAWLGAWRLK